MRSIATFVVFVAVFAFAHVVQAQSIASTDAPMLIKSTYAPLGLYAPDVVSPSLVGMNPAGAFMATRLYGIKTSAEMDRLIIAPKDGPRVNARFGSAFFRMGGVDARVSYYGISSSTAPAIVSQGMPVSFRGNALEISLAKACFNGKGSIGVAFLPYDESRISIGGDQIVGKAKSDVQFRFGALYNLDKRWSFGAVAGYESDTAFVDIAPTVSGYPDVIRMTGKYHINTGVVGVSFTPRLGTTLAANYVYQEIHGGSDGARFVRVPHFGVTQFVSPELGVNFSYVDCGKAVSLFYAGKNLQVSAGYTFNSFRSVQEYVGKSDLCWAAVNWVW